MNKFIQKQTMKYDKSVPLHDLGITSVIDPAQAEFDKEVVELQAALKITRDARRNKAASAHAEFLARMSPEEKAEYEIDSFTSRHMTPQTYYDRNKYTIPKCKPTLMDQVKEFFRG